MLDATTAIIDKDLKVLGILKKYKVNIYDDVFALKGYDTYESIQKKYRNKSYMTNQEWEMVLEWLER